MQLYKMQTNLFSDVVNIFSFLVDKNAYNIWSNVAILECFEQFSSFSRLNISRTGFVEHQAEQVSTGISGRKKLIFGT